MRGRKGGGKNMCNDRVKRATLRSNTIMLLDSGVHARACMSLIATTGK